MRSLLENAKDEVLKRIPRRGTGSTVRSSVGGARQSAKEAKERLRHSGRAERWRNRERAGVAALAGVAGGAGAYFLDPKSGKRRRHIARDKAASLLRRGEQRLERAGRHGAHTATGKVKGAAAGMAPERPAPNDEVLADRVRSEVFRPEGAPKGSVSINVEHGIVYLRGEADPKQARKLVKNAKSVDGVEGVKSLLNTHQ